LARNAIYYLSYDAKLAVGGPQGPPVAGKKVIISHLEEVKVITRFPYVNIKNNNC
jgi:hypothetical protein